MRKSLQPSSDASNLQQKKYDERQGERFWVREKEREQTGAAEPGHVIGDGGRSKGRERGGRKIDPFGGVKVLVEIVLHESPLQSLPVYVRRLHFVAPGKEIAVCSLRSLGL